MGQKGSSKKQPSAQFQAAASKFTPEELQDIQIKFRTLAERSKGPTVDKGTFLKYFPIPGLIGEQLFTFFDSKKTGVVDFEEFICGLAIFSRGTSTQKLEVLFSCYDLNDDGSIHTSELSTMLGHLPTDVCAGLRLCRDAIERIPDSKQWFCDIDAVEETPSGEGISEDAESKSVGISRRNEEDVLSVVEEHHSRIVEEMVRVAFENCDLNKDGMLSFAQFAYWVERNADLMEYMEGKGHAIPKGASTPKSSNSIAMEQSSKSGTGLTVEHYTTEASDNDSHVGSPEASAMFEERSRSKSFFGHSEFMLKNMSDASKTGYLWKQGSRFKRFKKRYYRIVDNFLYYFHKEEDVNPSGAIFLDGVFVESTDIDQTSERWPFVVFCSVGGERDRRVLYAESRDSRASWIKAIQNVSHYSDFNEEYITGRLLGSGRFAKVYHVERRHDGKIFACKVIDKTTLKEDERELIRSEVSILKLVHHPNIIVTEQVLESRENINIITEIVKGGELLQHISGRSTLSEAEAYSLFVPVIKAIKYLHTMGIVHRDLKPENILCDSGFKTVKLADFGLGKLVKENTVLARKCGTLVYAAPEILTESGYTKQADMWSIGVIMFLVLRGRLPYQGDTAAEIVDRILTTTPNFNDKSWRRRSPELRDFVQKLLQRRPEARTTSSEALEHPWLEKNTLSFGDKEKEDRKETISLIGKWSDVGLDDLKSKLQDVQKENQDLESQLTKGRELESEIAAEIEKRVANASK